MKLKKEQIERGEKVKKQRNIKRVFSKRLQKEQKGRK